MEDNNIAKKEDLSHACAISLDNLTTTITEIVADAKRKLATGINVTITEAYWNIGKHIVEFEQNGDKYASYGSSLLTRLAQSLTLRLGKGYSRPNLNNMRMFYLLYPNCQTVSNKFSWSHICEFIRISDPVERPVAPRTARAAWI